MKRAIFGTLSVLMLSGSAVPPVALANEASTVSAESDLLTRGSFVTAEQDHPTAGAARIIADASGQRYLVLGENFTTAEGPDVQAIVYRGATVPTKGLSEQNYITLDTLESFDGEQRYAIPAGVEVEEYGSVAIWCREFNVTFGYAPLTGMAVNVSLSPFELVSMANRGMFEEQGIPSFGLLASEVELNSIDAQDLVRAAIARGELPEAALADDNYLNAVETQLEGLRSDG